VILREAFRINDMDMNLKSLMLSKISRECELIAFSPVF